MAQSSATISQTREKGYAPLEFHAGEDVTISVEINTSSGDESLSGDTLEWTMRRRGSRLNVLEKETGDGITITSASDGTADISLSSADTDTFTPGIYEHQLWLKDSSGNYEQVLQGLIRLQKQLVFGSKVDAFEET